MIKISEKEKVSKFIVDEMTLSMIWKGGVYENDELLFEGEVNSFDSFKGSFFIITNNFKDGILINRALGLEKYCATIGDAEIFFDQTSILRNRWNDDYTASSKRRISLLDNHIDWEVETYFSKPIIIDNIFFGFSFSKLYRINPETGQPLWHKNLEEYGFYVVNGKQRPPDIQAYIGIYGDVLYVKVGTMFIIGVDVSMGKEVFKYEYDKEVWALDNHNVKLDVERGVIFSIGRKNYFELDLSTKTASLSDHFEQTKEFGVETTRLGGWEGDQIYFWEGSINNKFGIFNRSSKTITFVAAIAEVEGMFPAIKDVQFGKDRLYVLDHNNKLHVFGADNEVA